MYDMIFPGICSAYGDGGYLNGQLQICTFPSFPNCVTEFNQLSHFNPTLSLHRTLHMTHLHPNIQAFPFGLHRLVDPSTLRWLDMLSDIVLKCFSTGSALVDGQGADAGNVKFGCEAGFGRCWEGD